MDRRKFIRTASLSSFGLAIAGTSCGVLKYRNEMTYGHGSHQYRIRENWSSADQVLFPIKDAHEMVQVKDGRLFLITNETKNNILIFDKSGKLLDSWGTQFPGGHGLTLHDEGGTEYLYITDYELHKVFKTTLDGVVVLTIDAPIELETYSTKEAFKPTETAIGPDGSIYVADGYGAQWITVFGSDGKVQNQFGGPDHFQNAHGICLDTRSEIPSLLISAREQQMLKRFSTDGEWMEDISLSGAHINRAVIQGDNVYFSVLKSNSHYDRGSGFLMVLDKNNKVISCPGGSDPTYNLSENVPYHQTIELFKYPHDVCVDQDENLYIPQWNAGGVYPIMLERV